MHCARPRDYHSLGLTRIQFHPPKVTPLTDSAKVTDQGFCYCKSDAWGWHNSHQSGVISITDQLIFENRKKLLSSIVISINFINTAILQCTIIFTIPCNHQLIRVTILPFPLSTPCRHCTIHFTKHYATHFFICVSLRAQTTNFLVKNNLLAVYHLCIAKFMIRLLTLKATHFVELGVFSIPSPFLWLAFSHE